MNTGRITHKYLIGQLDPPIRIENFVLIDLHTAFHLTCLAGVFPETSRLLQAWILGCSLLLGVLYAGHGAMSPEVPLSDRHCTLVLLVQWPDG